MSALTERCSGCGAIVPESEGPTHRYLGASPGCWALFGEVLARGYEDFRYGVVHKLTVDVYAVQHPGNPSPQTIQSLATHLISLHLMLEQGYSPGQTIEPMRRAKERLGEEMHWLEPPGSLGPLTVLDLTRATSPAQYTERVWKWARSVWEAWAPHHETIRAWAGKL